MNVRSCHVRGALAVALALGLAADVAAQQGGGQQQQTAPTGVVAGQVTHGVTLRPVSNAQVFVVGGQVGSLTNAEGRFTITGVPVGPRVVRVQSVGYGTLDRPVVVEEGATATVNFEVHEEAIAIDQVVVTALGIRRGDKSLGFAVQNVSAAALERSSELSFVSALAGQVAGTQITESTGQPGGSARLVIRGEGSFRGDGQPLYVIDGVPIIVDIDRNSYDPLQRGEASSRAIDIDPINIEEISVLRGAAATALYGSRAALGAVIIRTKQGTPGVPMRFTVTSRVGQEEPVLEGLQTTWAQGAAGFYCNGRTLTDGGWCQPGHPDPDPLANLSWGPHRDSIPQAVMQHEGQIRFRDPRLDFYQSGLTSTQSIYGTGSITSATYGLGFSYTNQEGVFTKSKLDRLNLNANLTVNLNRSVKSQTTILFSTTGNDRGWEGSEGLTSRVSLLPPSLDISKAYNDDGTPVMFGNNTPHPQWVAENEYATSSTARWIVSEKFSLDVGRGLTLSNQVGLDSYLDDRQEFQNERPWLTAAGVESGGSRQQKITRRSINDDLVLTLDHRRLGDGRYGVSGLVGGNVYAASVSDISGWGENLSIPGFYNLNNFTDTRVTATVPAKRRLLGLYTQATFDYRDWAFLTLTGRNDWSSTLPLDGNSYFYPSASLAVILTDALGWQSSLLNYGKVRLSLSKVGSEPPPYRLGSPYLIGDYVDFSSGTGTSNGLVFPFRDIRGFVQGDNLGNPAIKPERTVEAELGFEMLLFNGHARADISLYHRRGYDQVFSVPVAASSGYKTITQNAGDLKNRGIEVSIGGTPVRSEAVSWDVRMNVSRNWSSVVELAEGVNYIPLAGPDLPQIRIMEDHGYGVIWGSGYSRDESGRLLIGADGWPIVDADPRALGEIQPKWLGNFSSALRYRSLTLSGLLDVRRGGDIVNGDLRTTIPAGTAEITADRNDRFVWDGVTAGGQANSVELVRDQDFWTRYAMVDENLVESGSAVRLREATLAWALPSSFAGWFEMQSMSVFATGRNLKVWSPFSYGDPDGSNYGSVNAGGAGYRLFTVPSTRTWSVGVRASF